MNKMMERIDNERKNQGLTQAQICEPLKIQTNTYTGWLKGNVHSYRKYLPEIATILGVTTDYIAFGRKTENEEFFRLWEETEPEIQEAVLTILRHNRNKGMKDCRGDVTRK